MTGHVEPVGVGNPGDSLLKHGILELGDLSAATADHVLMVPHSGGAFVKGVRLVGIYLTHETGFA